MAKGRPRKVDSPRAEWQSAEVVHKKTGYFEPPPDLRPDVLEIWETYWQDPVSNVAATVDKNIILRWIKMVNLYNQMMDDFADTPFTYDDRMRKRANPSFDVAEKLLMRIMAYESQLGIGPRNRINLGLTLVSTARTLEAINSDYEGRKGESEPDDRPVRADPRLSHIVGRVEE